MSMDHKKMLEDLMGLFREKEVETVMLESAPALWRDYLAMLPPWAKENEIFLATSFTSLISAPEGAAIYLMDFAHKAWEIQNLMPKEEAVSELGAATAIKRILDRDDKITGITFYADKERPGYYGMAIYHGLAMARKHVEDAVWKCIGAELAHIGFSGTERG